MKRLGQIFVAKGEADWMQSRAYVPTPWRKNSDELRVFVSFLDEHSRGRVGYVDLDSNNPTKVLRYSKNPVLDLGKPGAFDEHGVTPLCISEENNDLWLYYVGWQIRKDVPYSLLTGLAISHDRGESFVRVQDTPIFAPSIAEPHIRTAPFVLKTHEGYSAWYHSCSGWYEAGGKKWPMTDLRFMKSSDGIHWPNEGRILFASESQNITGYGRPWIERDRDQFILWVAERSIENVYRLVKCVSDDGLRWSKPEAIENFEDALSDWDNKNQSAPATIQIKNNRYLFYNGNQFGVGGFGAAVETKPLH